MTLWKAARADTCPPTDGGNRRRAGNLSGHGTEGAPSAMRDGGRVAAGRLLISGGAHER